MCSDYSYYTVALVNTFLVLLLLCSSLIMLCSSALAVSMWWCATAQHY